MPKLLTEQRNLNTINIDKMGTAEMLAQISKEDYNAVKAVESAHPQIARAVDLITEKLANGGRLFYAGAGTSGRVAVLDASECPPTYGVPYEMVVALMAGGEACLARAGEGEEDIYENGEIDLKSHNFTKDDILVGISAAGGAPFVLGCIDYAKSLGANTIAVSSNDASELMQKADISIFTNTGAEVVTGSTRMKAGTAQKLVLNMLSTCAMIKLGKVYENYMINLEPSNIKLRHRMVTIVADVLKIDLDLAEQLLEKHNWKIRTVIDNEK